MPNNAIIVLISIFTLLVFYAQAACTANNTLVGCTSCDPTSTLAINATSNLFVCVIISNCTIVDVSGNCLQCGNGTVLNKDNLTNPTVTTCIASNSTNSGCKVMENNKCASCISSSYSLSNGTCILSIYDYCWKVNASVCTQCSDENIFNSGGILNCSVSTILCPAFDYQKWICPFCNVTNTTLHQSGIFCYNTETMKNCLVISSNTCLECKFGYYLLNATCTRDTSHNLQFVLLNTTYYLNSSSDSLSVCLNKNSIFNATTCSKVSTSINYCSEANLSLCKTCVKTFYLVNNTCYPCSSAFSDCLVCDQTNCNQCEPTFFLVLQSNTYTITEIIKGVSTTVTSCLPCTIYGCLYCRSEFDTRGIFNVRCDQCLFGYKLHNHTCISCPEGSYFSLSERICLPCKVNNCTFCNQDVAKCEQCQGNLYFNSDLSSCANMIDILSNTQLLNDSIAYEILNKSMPFSSTIIINDQKLLMTNCANSSNGFACLCNSSSIATFTSLCYPLNPNLSAYTLDPLKFSLLNTSISTDYFIDHISSLLLLSELPNYNWIFSPKSTELISNDQFANYLQITSNYIRNHVLQASTSVQSLCQLVFSQLNSTFDPYQSTILSGAGYYFKYTPANAKDDTTVVSLSQTNIASIVFLYFNSTVDSSLKRITGTAYVYLDQASTQLNLKLKKISFLGNNENYMVMHNDNQLSLSVSSDSDGFVTITNISTSYGSTLHSYYVSSKAITVNADQFIGSKIENLIYRVAFIYILIFLVLYLTLLPFCALFDCVDNKSSKRKIKTSDEETYQGIKHRSESEIQDQIALKINYKDFFPIYNIANTDRPRRLLKLCLFLVNSQHSITFLSLIYFHLPAGQPLIAVLLAIPAYLCTVILGYLCGLFTLKIPGNWKYLINLISLGYWILWIPIMSSFYSYEYSPFVFTFAIIFFFIDMLIDFLETLLMYFTIKQESRQIKLFKALSKWLSYRGYYQFDRMAKNIDQVRDNA